MHDDGNGNGNGGATDTRCENNRKGDVQEDVLGGQAWQSIKLPPSSSVGNGASGFFAGSTRGSVEAEASPSPNTVPWCIDLCQLGSG